MADIPDLRSRRRSIRLPTYDYSSAGAYFVTLCVEGRRCLLGHVANGIMVNNPAGDLIQEQWLALPTRFPGLELDWFQVMPNHIHGILMLRPQDIGKSPGPCGPTANGDNRADTRPAPTLGDVVCALKSIVAVQYIKGVRQQNWPPFEGRLLQRDYYEHILKDEEELAKARRYIEENPLQWSFDRENPEAAEVADDLPWEES